LVNFSPRSRFPQVATGRYRRISGLFSQVRGLNYYGFDSRQLHKEDAGQSHKLWPVFFSSTSHQQVD
jgi:hypothetical protein